jgi:hypothetical protein
MWNVTLHAYVCVCLYIKMVYVFNKINWIRVVMLIKKRKVDLCNKLKINAHVKALF